MGDLQRQLNDYRLTTAEILYHMPDHPHLLQSFVWQFLDRAPLFPELRKFLDFWNANIDGKIHSVSVTSCEVVRAARVRYAQSEFRLH